MGIDLGGGNVAMAKHHLYRAKIGAPDKKIGGKRMAEDVGTDLLGNTGGKRCCANDLPETVPGHGPAPVGAEQYRA